MNPIVALWAHPRSRSTALERVFIERGDFHVLHEPFSTVYYARDERAVAKPAACDAESATDYATARDQVVSAGEQSMVCFKDMAYHGGDALLSDAAFLSRISNVFLVRDPRPTIASHYAMNPQVTQEEIGYERLAELFDAVTRLTGAEPPVIDAEQLAASPDRVLSALCDRLGLPHAPEAASWTPGRHEKWRVWHAWHDQVSSSAGIQATATTYEHTVDNHPKLAEFYDRHAPHYERMVAHRVG